MFMTQITELWSRLSNDMFELTSGFDQMSINSELQTCFDNLIKTHKIFICKTFPMINESRQFMYLRRS